MVEMTAAAYQLIDTDSASLLGSYPSEWEALRAVATAAKKYGRDSEAVTNLVLFRLDGPEDNAFVAGGAQLVERALAALGRPTGRTPTRSNGRPSSTSAEAKTVIE